jgi:hypothetical protein
MHATESDGTRECHTTPQPPVSEVFTARPRSCKVPAATGPFMRLYFCAAMYDYCLTPQYWEAF